MLLEIACKLQNECYPSNPFTIGINKVMLIKLLLKVYTLSTIPFMVFVICKGRGGWMSKPEQLQKNKRTMNIFQQEKLIAEKKKEIEARMAEKARMTSQNSSKTVSPR